ncbi:golgin subfamily B member 1 [Platysternon megacephalum]|uniref:Golgin subfamily B member 1 n=1 Tax=Platysternon megacephalum TaxID=55544 RepID=A0A4D9DQS3_9SAUR|nr:golgin subfamily B member 1 [Platysternon megacephalum]
MGHTSSFSSPASHHLPGAPSPGLLTVPLFPREQGPPLVRYTVEGRAPVNTGHRREGAVVKTRPRLFNKQLQQLISCRLGSNESMYNPNPGSSAPGPATSVSQAWPWAPFHETNPIPSLGEG